MSFENIPSIPDNTRHSMNMHYQSDETGEFGTIRLHKGMPVEQVLRQYAALFPIECSMHLKQIQDVNNSLHRPGGMSKEGIVMAIGKIPRAVFLALEFLDIDYWMDGKNFRKFVRAYPKFAIGDHTRKTSKGVIVK